MEQDLIKSEKEYQEALSRAMQIFHAEEGTPEDFELNKLLHLIKDSEERTIKEI